MTEQLTPNYAFWAEVLHENSVNRRYCIRVMQPHLVARFHNKRIILINAITDLILLELIF